MELLTGSADKKLISQWDERLRACQQARLRFEREWHYNMAFFFGRQWVRIVQSGNNFNLAEEKPGDSWRVRHTANRILRIVRTELTKLTKEEPQFYCVPKSTEQKDRLAALAGETISEFLMSTKYFNRKRSLATFWAIMCGTSYLKNSYSNSAIEADGLPGKIEFNAITAFHLFVPNLITTEMEDQPYVIQAEALSPETVYEMYGTHLEPGTVSNSDSFSDTRFLTSLGIMGEVQQNTKSSLCYVKEVYVKPCKDFPNGAFFVYGENQLLYVEEALPELPELSALPGTTEELLEEEITPVGDLGSEDFSEVEDTLTGTEVPAAPVDREYAYPYNHKRFPFTKIDHIPTGMWYCDSIIKSLIPSQKQYNRTRSIMLEHRNITSQPQYSYTAGAFDPRRFTGKPRLLLPIAMGFDPPRPIEQPDLDSAAIGNDLEITLRDMDDISSQFEVSKGRTPPGVEAASAIAYLSEENDSILHFTIQGIENAVQETGVQILSNVHQYWDPERIVKMTSDNQFLEIRAFKSTDLNPITDFRVVPGSMAPRSEAAKQAFIVDLMDRGLPLEKALKYLKMNETNKLYDDLMLDSNHAVRENYLMAQGNVLRKELPMTPDPNTGLPPVTMGPDGQPVLATQYKTDVERDEMGAPVIDETTGQQKTYEVTINPFDNHEIHIEEHQNFQKTQEFEMLPIEIRQIIQDHVDEHKAELVKEQNALTVSQIRDAEVQAKLENAGDMELEQAPQLEGIS